MSEQAFDERRNVELQEPNFDLLLWGQQNEEGCGLVQLGRRDGVKAETRRTDHAEIVEGRNVDLLQQRAELGPCHRLPRLA